MKNLISLLLVAGALSVSAQRNKAPKMAKVFTPGYYVTTRNDTVHAQIWINPDDETEFYKGFSFITSRSKKPRPMNAQKAKAYGFDNRNFIMVDYQGQKLFVERLVTGRLRFYEYKYDGKSNGYPAIEAAYFIKDTQAEGENAELGTIKKISNKFYKKSLKPYMKEQPMIWSDLDKYTFNEQNVVKAVKEFNDLYVTAGN